MPTQAELAVYCASGENCLTCKYPDCLYDGSTPQDFREAHRRDVAARIADKDRRGRKLAAQQRAYREANREKLAAQKHAYYEANKEKLAAQQRAYYEANRQKLAAQQRAYYEANREKWKTIYAENRRKKSAINQGE